MKYCKNCDLKINSHQTKCLFCGADLEEINNKYLSSFQYKRPTSFYIEKVKKIVAFCLLILILISGFLEYYLFNDKLYWVLVSFSSIYIYCVLSISLNFSKGIVAKISNISILTSLEVIGIFIFFNLDVFGICLTYVFPGICIVSLIAMIIIYLITKGKNVHDQLIYIFINAFYGFIPVLFMILKLVETTYICSICNVFSFLTLLAFVLFVDKDSTDELIRRFHI